MEEEPNCVPFVYGEPLNHTSWLQRQTSCDTISVTMKVEGWGLVEMTFLLLFSTEDAVSEGHLLLDGGLVWVLVMRRLGKKRRHDGHG